MLTSQDLTNPLSSKVVFAKIFYIEGGVQKYYLFSDKFKKFSNGDVPELRLSSIPFFKKEIDPINNSIIIQSAYKISLLNDDDVLTPLFQGKIFNNQVVEFYLSTEDSTDEILIAKGVFDDANISNTIEINLKEISDLTKVNKLNKFSTYSEDHETRLTEYNEEYDDETEKDTQNPEFKDKVKKVVLGKYPLVKCENTNPVESSDKWTTSRVWGYIEKVASTNYYRLYVTNFPNASGYVDFEQETKDTPHIQKLRKSAFKGDFLTIAGWEDKFTFSVASSLYTTSTADPLSVSPLQNKYINLQFEEGDESYFTNALSAKVLIGEILVKASDGVHYNDEFHVSDNTSSTFESTTVTGLPAYSQENILHSDDEASYPGVADNALNQFHKIHQYNSGENWIQITDNWNFLEAGDLIDLEIYYADMLQSSEQFEVLSYDIATKKIYFKEPDRLSVNALYIFGLSDPDYAFKVKFEKVQKIKVKNKTLFLKKNHFDLKIGVDGNGNFHIDKYPFLLNYDYQDEVEYAGGFDFFSSAYPGIRVYVKKNAFHILQNLAQVGRGQFDVSALGMFDGNTIMHFAVTDLVDYATSDNCMIHFQYDARGDFYKNDGNNAFNYNFFKIKIRSGVCTVAELVALSNDINCPFVFTYDSSLTPTDIISLDALTTSGTVLASTTTYVEVSSSDYAGFNAGDYVWLPHPSTPPVLVVLTSKAIVDVGGVDKYRLYYSTQPFSPTVGGTIQNTLRADYSTWYFRIPGFFSCDINQAKSLFGTNDNNYPPDRSDKYLTSARRQSEQANLTASTLLNLEKDADVLIRKANEKSKLFFGWWLEHNGAAADSAYDTYTDKTYKTKSIESWIKDASESFGSMVKPGYSYSNNKLSRLQKYGNFINLCPLFNLNQVAGGGYNQGWGGSNVPNFGYNSGTQVKKDQAMAQAIANRINQQCLYGSNINDGLKIIAVAVKDGSTWYVRIKHMTYNNCSTNVFKELWDTMDNNIEVVSKPTNYCAFIPFIRNNSLFIKLDRKALSLANSVGTDENFYLINLSGATDAEEVNHYLNDYNHFKVAFNDTVKNGNNSGSITSWYSLPISEQVDKNPNQLVRRYTGFNYANLLNFTAPNVFSKEIGATDYKKLVDPDKSWIIENKHYLTPDIFHVITEKLHRAYKFNNNTDDSKTFYNNEGYYLTADNYYQMSNWDSIAVQPNFGKKNFWKNALAVKVAYWGCKIVEPFELSKNDYVYASFKDKNSNLGSILESLFSIYGITNYASLSSVKALGITGYIILDKEQEFYKSVNPMLEANNMVCFVDKDNLIRFEKLNLKSTVADKSLSYYETISMSKDIEFAKFSKIIINYLKDETTEQVQTQEILNPAKDSIFTTFGINNPKKIEAAIISPVVNTDDLAMLVQKYTEENEFITIETDLSCITLDLNDIIEQEFKDGTKSKWVIIRKETNFSSMRFKMIKTI